jgi:hypothetical protein
MRKFASLLIALLLVAGVGAAAVTADVEMALDGVKLVCKARFHGIEKGQTFKPTFRWTAPSRRFVNSEWTMSKHLGDANPQAWCRCADTNEKGCSRSWAERKIEYVNIDGKTVRAVGEWTCEVLVDGEVVGKASFSVE